MQPKSLRFLLTVFPLLILIFLFFNSSVSSQSLLPKTKWYTREEMYLRGEVKEMIIRNYMVLYDSTGEYLERSGDYNGGNLTYYFSRQGWTHTLEEMTVDSLGIESVWSKAQFLRDNKGNVVKWEERYPDDKDARLDVTYKLNEKGLLVISDYHMINDNRDNHYKTNYEISNHNYISETIYFQEKLDDLTQFSFENKGRKVIADHYRSTRNLKRTAHELWRRLELKIESDSLIFINRDSETFDKKGNLIRHELYKGKSDSVERYTEYERKSDGKLMFKKTYRIEGFLNPIFVPEIGFSYLYNKEGDVIEYSILLRKGTSTDWESSISAKYTYEYDNFGNWTEKTTWKDGLRQNLEIRTISYY